MPRSLETRRLAIVDALRDIEREATRDAERSRRHADERRASRLATVEQRVARLDERLDDAMSRLDSVETTLLESAWEEQPRPGAEPLRAGGSAPDEDGDDETPRIIVPPVPDVTRGGMSPVAARALFGD